MGLFSDIASVFICENKKFNGIISPRDCTEKYRNELPQLFIDTVIVATDYNSIEGELKQYKFYSQSTLSSVFVSIYEDIVKTTFDNNREFVLTVVPMHWTRYFIRGFHHMEKIVKELNHKIGIPYKPLLKTSFTKRQSKLSRQDRFKNRKNIFRFIGGKNPPKTVILIDDVISTGATVNECAKTLKHAGVQEVIVLALATN